MCLSCSRVEASILRVFGSSSTIRILPILIAPPPSLPNGISRQAELEAKLFSSFGRNLHRTHALARDGTRDRESQARSRRLRAREGHEGARIHKRCRAFVDWGAKR